MAQIYKTASSSSMLSSSTSHPFLYDVFISFRGCDTREGFAQNLNQMFKTHQIESFYDSENLEKGEQIEKLFDYIDNTHMFVLIISPNYADSKWCLKELTRIVQSKRRYIPVFYDVDPSDVRNLTGKFCEGYQSQRTAVRKANEETMSEWRRALSEVGNASGYVIMDDDAAAGNTRDNREWVETKIVELITQDVLKRARRPIDVAQNPVGVETHVDEVLHMLEEESCHDIVVIEAVGGAGKTTVAKAVHNAKLADTSFDSVVALLNVRELQRTAGAVALQKQLISNVLKVKEASITINNVEGGKEEIKKKLQQKVVFLILDDIDDCVQLEAVVGSLDWFGMGSKLVITTRDASTSRRHFKDHCSVYPLAFLDPKQSLQLFCLHAFSSNQPLEEFKEESQCFVDASGGLPLALTVFGSHLCIQRDMTYWEAYLSKIQSRDDIEGRLKISTYDTLELMEQKVFLDIACLFIGVKIEDPMLMWEAAGFQPEITVKSLIAKSLIQIDEDGTFQMHDHIRDMGRRVIEEDPTHGIRLNKDDPKLHVEWNHLSRHFAKGTENIEAISIPRSYGIGEATYEMSKVNQYLKEMYKLRLLHLTVTGDPPNEPVVLIPSHLVWLKLESNDPFEEFELEFPNILRRNNVPPHPSQVLRSLAVLDIKGFDISHALDFRKCPNLKKLMISFGEDFDLDGSAIGCLQSLIHLNIDHYYGTVLPDEIGSLRSLRTFVLRNAYGIEELPKSVADLINLMELTISYCSNLKRLPDLQGLVSLKSLKTDSCDELESIPSLPSSLECLELYSNEKLRDLPADMRGLVALKSLQVHSSGALESLPPLPLSLECLELMTNESFRELPYNIQRCTALKSLTVYSSSSLRSIPPLPSSLEHVDFSYNESLQELPDMQGLTALEYLKVHVSELASIAYDQLPLSLKHLEIIAAKYLEELPDLQRLTALEHLTLESLPLKSLPMLPSSLRTLNINFLWRLVKLYPHNFQGLTALENLYLSYLENLETIDPDELPTSVKHLELNVNKRLWRLPDLRGLTELEYLSVSDSPILFVSGLPSSLKHLDLTNTDIREFSFLFQSQLPKLEILVMKGYSCYQKHAHPDSLFQQFKSRVEALGIECRFEF